MFEPLIKIYTKKLNYEEAETYLIIVYIEIIKNINLNLFAVKNGGLIVSYTVGSLKHKKINLFRKHVTNTQDSLEINMDLIYDETDMRYKSRIFL